jgi:hypothetical protein
MSAPCCVNLTTCEETDTSETDNEGDNSYIDPSQYPDLVEFARPNADNDVGGGGLAGCYHLHCEDYND